MGNMEAGAAWVKPTERVVSATLFAVHDIKSNVTCPLNIWASLITTVSGIAKNPTTDMVGALLRKIAMEMA